MECVSLLRSMFITVLPSRRIKYRYENWQYRSCQWIKVYIVMKSLLFRRTGIIIFQQKVSITARMSIKLCQTSTIAVWRLNRFQILLLVRWGPFFGHVHSILDIALSGFRANDQYFLWGRFPRVFGDKFGEKFGEKFGDSLNLVKTLVTNSVTKLVNHQIWWRFWWQILWQI